MICGNCGKEVSDTAKFCRACGKPPLAVAAASPAPAVSRTPDDEETVLLTMLMPVAAPPPGPPPGFAKAPLAPPAGPPPGRPPLSAPPVALPAPQSQPGNARMMVAALVLLVGLGAAYYAFRQFTSSVSDEEAHAVFLDVALTEEGGSLKVITETGATVYQMKFSKDQILAADEWVPADSAISPLTETTTWGIPFHKHDEYFVIDRNGRKITKPAALPIAQFVEGLAPATIPGAPKGSKCGYADRNFTMAIPAVYDNCYQFSDGMAVVSVGAASGYVNHAGKLQIPLHLTGACGFSEGLAKVTQDGKQVFIDKNGKVIFGEEDGGCQEFSQSRVQMVKGGHWGYADRAGNLVIPAKYEGATKFKFGRAFVVEGNQTRLIDLQGKEILLSQTGIEAQEEFEQGLARVKVAGSWGLVDTAGRTVVHPEFHTIDPLIAGLRSAERTKPPGVDFLDAQGRLVKPPLRFCMGYRAGVFTCADVKEAVNWLQLIIGGAPVSYITRSGTRIGGLSFTVAGKSK